MLVLVFVIALGVRLAYLAVQTWFGLFDVSFVAADSVLYLDLAQELASGRGLSLDGHPTAYVGPMYPLFLTPFVSVGAGPGAIAVGQAVVGALGAALAAALTAELTPRDVPDRVRIVLALVAGHAAAFYPHLVQWTGYVLTETLFVTLVAASFLLVATAHRRRSRSLAAAAGFTAGCAALTRAPYLAISVIIAVVWLLAARRERISGSVPVLYLLLLAVVVGSWGIRNAFELGAPVLTSTESGFVFYQGNSRDATGGSRGYVDGLDFTDLPLPLGLNEVERDSAYLRQALMDMREDPMRVVARWPTKLWNMWRPSYEGASPRNLAITIVTYLPVLVVGSLGALVVARRGPPFVGVLPVLFVVAWLVIHVLVTGMIRFRVAAEWMLLVVVPFGLALFTARLMRAR